MVSVSGYRAASTELSIFEGDCWLWDWIASSTAQVDTYQRCILEVNSRYQKIERAFPDYVGPPVA